jgi:Raf kinase inhibitor-like YbhB/YbcL family protein
MICDMKTISLATMALAAMVLFGGTAAAQTPGGTLKITSPAFQNGAMIPAKYSCDADKVNPPLVFAGVPASAKSLALIIDDPDVPKTMIPTGEFVHWLLWDIPASSKGIPEADKSASTSGLNGTGKPGYYPMCPPDREHRYFFKLYALDSTLGSAKITNKEELLAAMKGHTVAQAELMARYPKKR